MKFLVRTVVLLLIVNISLIYMHYLQAGDALAQESKTLTHDQEIEVMNRPDGLYIRQHFSGLSEGRYEIVWPEESVERSCYLADATSCDRLDDNATAFLDGENGNQSISYKITKKDQMKQAILFNEPFAVLHGSSVKSTLFHMTDETGAGGMWINGLKQVGSKKMELIDYTLFRGSGEVKDLYWQPNKLPLLYAGEKLAVFGMKGNVDDYKGVDDALKTIDANHSTVVIDKDKPAFHTKRFVVSKNMDVDSVADLFLTSAMYNRFLIPQKEQMTAELMASILGGKATGAKKSRETYDKLTQSLTAEELGNLRGLLSDRTGQEIDATVLDGLVGEVTGFKTSYFTKNVQDEKVDYPFLIEDPREIQLDGTADGDIRIILKEGKTLYPANEILSHMGYSIKSNEQSIYIESGLRKFRFPRKELFYVYNERKYDVVTMPFEILEGDFYFEESWFKRLFLFTIDKTDDSINIVKIATQTEGGDK